MAKINIIGLISLILGGLIIGFQAIGNLVKESYNWEAMSLLDVLRSDQLRWVDYIHWELFQNAVIYVLSAPLYIIFLTIAGVCFLISFLLRL